jgi:peptide/nickel transport system substrate-binding protein
VTYRTLAALSAALLLSTFSAVAETVRWGRAGDAATLDPHAAADGYTQQLLHNIYEPLIRFEPGGAVSGVLAASWLSSAGDPNRWVFNLKRAVFHDGAEFDSDDVVFSINRARANGSAFADATSDIVAVRATNARSVEIRFATPSAVVPAVMSRILILDSGWAEENGDGHAADHANGTGPYKLDSRDAAVRTKLVAHERYAGPAPAAGEVIYLPIDNPAMQTKALAWGEIEVLQDASPADLNSLEGNESVAVETAPANSVLYLGYKFGGTDNPFDKPLVREAIDRAIDRAEVASFVDRGHADATAILAPSFVEGWSKGLAAQLSPNRVKAKELLTEAGYPDGFAVKLDVAKGDEAAANRIKAMLTSIGIWADVVARPAAAHEAHVASGASAFHLSGYSAPGYDSDAILEWLIDGQEGYSNSELSAQVEALAGMRAKSERRSALAKLWLDAQNERIVLPVAQRRIAHAMRASVSVQVDPNGLTRFDTIRFND